MRVVHLVGRFPKLSESFVISAVEEEVRQGGDVTVWSLGPGDVSNDAMSNHRDLMDRVEYVVGTERAKIQIVVATVLSMGHLASWRWLGWALYWAIAERRKNVLLAFPIAAMLARKLTRDSHIHAHFASSPGTIAFLSAMLRGCTFSMTAYGKDIYEDTSARFLAAKLAGASFMDVGTRSALLELSEVLPPSARHKLNLIRTGLALTHAPPARRSQDAANPRPIILSIGRLVEKKGHLTLVDAARILKDRGLSFKLQIIGDGPLMATLVARVQELGLEESTELLGSKPHQDLQQYYLDASVFALPSQATASGDRDGLPVAILEAILFGVPVVSTAVSGIPEVIRDGTSGLTVEERSPEQLAHALERLIDSPQLRSKIASGARSMLADFAIDANVAKRRALYPCHSGEMQRICAVPSRARDMDAPRGASPQQDLEVHVARSLSVSANETVGLSDTARGNARAQDREGH